jgi:tRNA splicing ligase
MKKAFLFSLVLAVLFVCLVVVISGCDDAVSPDNKDIEIKGTWIGTIELNGEEVSAEYTVSNSTVSAEFEGESYSFPIVKYDNESNVLIIKLTNHPVDEFNNKYMKMIWDLISSTNMILHSTPYNTPYSTLEEAEAAQVTDRAEFTKK